MSPEYLFEEINKGSEITPTDKNYKIYIDMKEPKPDEMVVCGISMDEKRTDGWVAADPEILDAQGFRSISEYKSMLLRPRGPIKTGKFYFQHFSEGDCKKFISLLNDGKIKIGYPGFFYRLPFFMQYAKPPAGKTGVV